MKNKIYDIIMPLVPKNDLSHWVGKLVHKDLPEPLASRSVEFFAKAYNINLEEAELPIGQYKSIGALFTRKLKAGVRPLGQGVVHPADSLITEAGPIEKLQCIQAKGKTYSVAELLRNTSLAQAFEGGQFATYYLCPTDYHRVHSPVDGEITWSSHIPGELWPVNEWSVNAIANLFSVNERIVTLIETPLGRAALVMVAATNVGNMTMSYDENISSKVREKQRAVKEKAYTPAKPIRRGDEVGIFHMGSTVVMLYEKGALPIELSRLKGSRVKYGESVVSH